jgi:hypothetical protein
MSGKTGTDSRITWLLTSLDTGGEVKEEGWTSSINLEMNDLPLIYEEVTDVAETHSYSSCTRSHGLCSLCSIPAWKYCDAATRRTWDYLHR